jgi:hypothetical protein
MSVPLLDLQGQYRPLREPLPAAIARVCDTHRFPGPAEVDAFERQPVGYLGVARALGFRESDRLTLPIHGELTEGRQRDGVDALAAATS